LVTFLANGQIGDIIVYSNSDKNFIKECINVARKIKFVPAKIGEKYVDATMVVDYATTIFVFSGN